MSARANPRASGPTLTPAGSLAARPAGWQRADVCAEPPDTTPDRHPSPLSSSQPSTPERAP